MSETDNTIHVVVFDPINGHAVGGFDWFYKREDANARFAEYLADDPRAHRLRQYVAERPADLTNEQITDWVDENFVSNGAELIPVNDSHRYTVQSAGVEAGDLARDFVKVTLTRSSDEDASVVVHQSGTDQPAVNIEIDGDFAGEESTASGALRVHLNDWPIYISQLNDSELSVDELRQYRRVLTEQLDALNETHPNLG